MADGNQTSGLANVEALDIEAAFKHAREEERYEVGLVSGRLASMLGSQSLLFTAWAILHGPNAPANKWLLFGLGVAGVLICMFSALAVLMALIVIRRWQKLVSTMLVQHGAKLQRFTVNRAAQRLFPSLGFRSSFDGNSNCDAAAVGVLHLASHLR